MLDFLIVNILTFPPSNVLSDALSKFLHVFIVPSLAKLWEFVYKPLRFLQSILKFTHCFTFKMLWIDWRPFFHFVMLLNSALIRFAVSPRQDDAFDRK